MPTLENVEQIIALYWEGNRLEVRKRYEELFGNPNTPAEGTSASVEEDESDGEVEQPDKDKASVHTDTEAAFSEIVEALELSDAIRRGLREAWMHLPEPDRLIALHHLELVGNPNWSCFYLLEGMLNFFGTWVATHLLHCFYPGQIFPIDTEQRYNRLRTILRTLGITYDDQEKRLSVDIAINLYLGIEDFRTHHQLEDWQMWALVYDLGPRLLPQLGPYPTDPPPRIWITAAGPENFAAVDNHTSSDRDTWSINTKARRGDFVLMYCRAPRSALVGVYRCGCDAYRDPFLYDGWGGVWTDITDKVAVPWLTFKEVKADPLLCKWQMAKTSFKGLLQHQVPDEVWRHIKEMVTAKDAEAGRLLEEVAQAAEGVRTIKGPGEALSEKELEEKLIVPLLRSLGWDLTRTIRRQYEMDIKVGSGRPHRVRADFVGFRDALSSEALLVLESKRRIRSDEELRTAIEQCESYAGKLRCTRFAVAAPEGLWIYTLNFPGQSNKLAYLPFQSEISPAMVEKLKPLIGFDAFRT